ncbi:hypothetical protein [Stenotrophomonas tuberculopleuritidis]|uniref:hypothetical protein n=1 Tax=Stenotrophomonas tuberculopleuritidis TaxID=3055079 RepID=UPI0026E553A0|nr:hypothetical protein [Stenotrophomonas sp. 704A1]
MQALIAVLMAVATHAGQAGESMDSFVLRVAPLAMAETKSRQAMVCGVIGEKDGSYSIRLRTDGDLGQCEIDMNDLEPGAASTGQTFHTHPKDVETFFSFEDYSQPGYVAQGRMVKHQKGRGSDRYVISRKGR